MKKNPKVTIWENNCGANVGKHVIHFTGLLRQPGDICPFCNKTKLKKIRYSTILTCEVCNKSPNGMEQGVYVTLKYPIWCCSQLIYIKSRSPNDLREAIRIATIIKKEQK